jgi:UDP-N-acetylglucosamine 1-carboxyvinyltransferase
MDIFLEKLREMGHEVITSAPSSLVSLLPGITLKATDHPRAVNIKTGPYPAFPTDLQAPMMAALCLADGTSNIEETVFENRMMHVKELQKMGAQIVADNTTATIRGVDELYGCEVIASDIRASCALVLAGMTALGATKVTGIHHWKRGYDNLDEKLNILGATINICDL